MGVVGGLVYGVVGGTVKATQWTGQSRGLTAGLYIAPPVMMGLQTATAPREAAMAYEILMRIRAMEGLERGSSGRYVHIKELNKLERQTLRNTFSVVKDVQLMLTSRYRIDFLR